MQVCYVCGQNARPGRGMTDLKGRRHVVCPPPKPKKALSEALKAYHKARKVSQVGQGD